MKIVFKTKEQKMNKPLKEKDVVQYNIAEEQQFEGIQVKHVDKIVPLITINQGNLLWIGYIPEDERLIIQFKQMRKSVEGFELGEAPEPFDYVYENISQKLWDTFLNTKNKVKFFEDNIKGNYFYHREEVWCSF